MSATSFDNTKFLVHSINGDIDVLYDVLIDSREKSPELLAKITKYLDLLGLTWRVMKLPCGDYLINRGRGLIIEMKSVNDLLGTMMHSTRDDGNALVSELKNMVNPDVFGGKIIPSMLACRNGATVKISVELNEQEETYVTPKKQETKTRKILQHLNKITFENDKGKKEERKGIHPNHWHGAEMLVQEFVPLIHFHGIDDFLQWMFARIEKEKKKESEMRNGTENIVAMTNVKRTATPNQTKRSVFEQLLGPKSAHKILSDYGTVRLAMLNMRKVEDLTHLGITRPASEYALFIIDDPYTEGGDIAEEISKPVIDDAKPIERKGQRNATLDDVVICPKISKKVND